MISATNPGVAAAGSTTTNRSTFPGSDARSGTQRTPSITSIPGLDDDDLGGVEALAQDVAQDHAPGVGPGRHADDADRARGQEPGDLVQRPRRAGGSRAVAQGDQDVERDEAVRRDRGRVDLDLEQVVRGELGELQEPRDGLLEARARDRRGGCPRTEVVASRTAVEPAMATPMASGGVRVGETMAISRPGRRSAASASVRIPPAPTATTGPRSSVQRRASSSSPPGPASWATNSATVKPSGGSSSRARIAVMAARTAVGSRGTTATPPTSVLCWTLAETTFTTTRSPGRSLQQGVVDGRLVGHEEPSRHRDPDRGEQRQALGLEQRRPAGSAGSVDDGPDGGEVRREMVGLGHADRVRPPGGGAQGRDGRHDSGRNPAPRLSARRPPGAHPPPRGRGAGSRPGSAGTRSAGRRHRTGGTRG